MHDACGSDMGVLTDDDVNVAAVGLIWVSLVLTDGHGPGASSRKLHAVGSSASIDQTGCTA